MLTSGLPDMDPLINQVIGAVACGVIIWRSEPALNKMTTHTHLAVRLAMWLVLLGAVARLWSIFTGSVPDNITVLMLAGIATLISCERRLEVLTHRKRSNRNETTGETTSGSHRLH